MKLSTMLCLAVASGKLFGSLWKAEDQESPARTPSLGVSEEISDLVDIETVPSPLRRMLKEAESDSTEAKDDKSDEDDEEDDGEDEDETEENNGIMQNAGALGGVALSGVALGGVIGYCVKGGAPVKTPQGGFLVSVNKDLSQAMVDQLNGDSKVSSVVEIKSRLIYTSYDSLEEFLGSLDDELKKEATSNAASKADHAVYALQGFEDAELTKVQRFKVTGMATKDSIKDRVILSQDQFVEKFRDYMTCRGEVEIDDTLTVKINPDVMIITKVPAEPAAAAK